MKRCTKAKKAPKTAAEQTLGKLFTIEKKPSNVEKKIFLDLCAKWCSNNSRSFSTVEDAGFIKIVQNAINLGYLELKLYN